MFPMTCAPLSTLQVGLEAVLDSVVEGAKAQQYLELVARNYLAHLVEQLLLLARQMLESYVFGLKQYLRWIAQECLFGCSHLPHKQT